MSDDPAKPRHGRTSVFLRHMLVPTVCIVLASASCAGRGPGYAPNDYQARNDLSASLNAEGRYAQALEAADRAIEADPFHPYAWNNRGMALLGLGRTDEALAAVDHALEQNPYNALAWGNRGVALRILGRIEEARAAAEESLRWNPKVATLWYNAACYYALLGEREQALKHLAAAIEREPGLRVRAREESDLEALRADREFQSLTE